MPRNLRRRQQRGEARRLHFTGRLRAACEKRESCADTVGPRQRRETSGETVCREATRSVMIRVVMRVAGGQAADLAEGHHEDERADDEEPRTAFAGEDAAETEHGAHPYRHKNRVDKIHGVSIRVAGADSSASSRVNFSPVQPLSLSAPAQPSARRWRRPPVRTCRSPLVSGSTPPHPAPALVPGSLHRPRK